jgi:hypothetical protein
MSPVARWQTPVMARSAEAAKHEDGLALFVAAQTRSRFRETLADERRRGKTLDRLDHFGDLDRRYATPVATNQQSAAALSATLRAKGRTDGVPRGLERSNARRSDPVSRCCDGRCRGQQVRDIRVVPSRQTRLLSRRDTGRAISAATLQLSRRSAARECSRLSRFAEPS